MKTMRVASLIGRRLVHGLVLTLLAGIALSGHATAAGTDNERQRFVIGVENLSYLPAYGVENGVYAGFARELFDAFAADAGYSFEYRPLPVQRLFATFFAGGVDFKFPDNPYWQGELRKGQPVVYSQPVITYIDGGLVRPDMAAAGVDDIKTLGTVTGFTPWAWQDLIKAGKVRLTENGDFTALTRQVLARRVDAVYASVAVMNYQLDTVLNTPGALVFNPKLPHSRDHYFLSTLNHPQVIAAFNAWLAANADRVAAMKSRHAVEKGVE